MLTSYIAINLNYSYKEWFFITDTISRWGVFGNWSNIFILFTLYHHSTTLQHMKKLNQAILLLKTKSEVDEFLNDLCTPAELKALDERWAVAQLLYRDEMSYREIAAKLNASTTTITRVARFLTNEPYKGYQKILKRINNEK